LDDDALSTVICKRQHGLAGIDFQHWTRFSPQASDEKQEDSTRSIALLYQTSWLVLLNLKMTSLFVLQEIDKQVELEETRSSAQSLPGVLFPRTVFANS